MNIPAKYRLLPSGFHGDKYFQEIAKYALDNANIYLENGANVGSTLIYVARNYPKLPCYACEISTEGFGYLEQNVNSLDNASVYKLDAIAFLQYMLEKDPDIRNQKVFFWLDAHGGNFVWPLKEEIKLITREFKHAIIFIDDFLVPGKPHFGWGEYEDQICSMDYIKGEFNPDLKYQVYYPEYTEKTSDHHPLRGWVLISYGMEPSFYDGLTQFKTIEKVASPLKAGRKKVIGYRRDRLGSRLNAMVNAKRVAKRMGYDCQLVWGRPWQDVLQDDVEPITDVFAESFIADNMMPQEEFFPLKPEKLPLSQCGHMFELVAERLKQDSANHLYLCDEPFKIIKFNDESPQEAIQGFAKTFRSFALNQELEKIRIDFAQKYSSYTALHLRRGDLIVRNDHFYFLEYRYAPLPIVSHFIAEKSKQGQDKFIVFSEDEDAIQQLQARHPSLAFFDSSDKKGRSKLFQAMVDILCLSECQEIVGTHSAFSDTAAKIGGIERHNILKTVAIEDQINALVNDDYSDLMNPYDRIILADLYQRSQQYDLAYEQVNTAIKERHSGIFLLYEALLMQKKHADEKSIQKKMKKAVAAEPDAYLIRKHYANHLILAGEYKMALDQLEHIRKIVDNGTYRTTFVKITCREALLQKLATYLQLKQLEDYMQTVLELTLYEDTDLSIYIEPLQNMIQLGVISEFSNKLLLERADGIQRYVIEFLQGLVSYLQKDYLLAKQKFQQIYNANNYNTLVLYFLANSCAQLQEFKQAVQIYYLILSFEPNSIDVYKGITEIFVKTGHHTHANDLLQKIITASASDLQTLQWAQQIRTVMRSCDIRIVK